MLVQVRCRGVCREWVREAEAGERCWQDPEETGARWGSRMTAAAESMKTRRLSWRGSADRGINILMTAFKCPIQHLFFCFFPFHDQTNGVLIFQISTETIWAVENTDQNYVEDGVVTTEGNADGNVKNGPLFFTPHTQSVGAKTHTNANKQSAAFKWIM